MRKLVIALVFLVVPLVGFTQAEANLSNIYRIIDEQPNVKLNKNSLDVRLDKKIGKEGLKEIAEELRENRKEFERLWIFYYLPDMPPGGGAWATSHFNPNLEIKILGSTIEEDNAIKASTEEVAEGKEVIGKWKDQVPGAESILMIYRKDDKLYLKTTYQDGSSSEHELKKSKANNRKRFDYVEYFHGEYFILERNNNLGMYSENGKFREATRIE